MYQFSDLALARMRASGSFTGYFEAVLLTRAPSIIPSNAAPASATLLADMGYQELVGTASPRPLVQTSQTSASAGTPAVTTFSVLLGGSFNLPADVPPTTIAAVAIVWHGTNAAGAGATLDGVVKPWLLITDESFGQIVYPGSTLTTVLQSPLVLWRWSLRGTIVDLTWPGLVRSPGTVAWEPPRTEHVFLYPQKVNYVPNPSFEDSGLFGWRSSGALTRVKGGVDNALNYYGHTAGTRLESIPASLTSRFVCVSAYVRSTGATWVRLGLANWSESWTPSPDSLSAQLPVTDTWTRVSYVAAVPDNVNGSGALFVANGSFDVDLVMLEPGAELHDYFDGDSQTALPGDISWQGVTHQSFSFWYNNRNLVGARLFGAYKDGLIDKTGLVYDWVPAGTSIYTHWDVLSMTDTGQPLVDFASRTIP